jgi:fumarylacetoacetate (FAA) hydrolase
MEGIEKMKLGTLKEGGRDGTLVIVDRDLQLFCKVTDIAATLQQALDNWKVIAPMLEQQYHELNSGHIKGAPVNFKQFAAPLSRAYQWLDGSAYLPHVERVRKARGADMPLSIYEDPLMYQGGSDHMLGPHDPIVGDEAWGIDFEGEVAVVTDDVPLGVSHQWAAMHIKLIALVNDVSLRYLIPPELAKGFGFLHGKPPTAFAPVVITPDELGDAWRNNKVHLRLQTTLNGQRFGDPEAGENMQFDFARLIQHAAKTRPLGAGTIIGSGTVSNSDQARGYSCIAEKRIVEKLETGESKTVFLKSGDRVRMEMIDHQGRSVFGAIEQMVQKCPS